MLFRVKTKSMDGGAGYPKNISVKNARQSVERKVV